MGKVASPEANRSPQGLDSGNPVSDATITDTPVYGQNNGISLIDLRGKDYNDPMWNQLLDELSAEDYRELVGHSGYGSNFVQSIESRSTSMPIPQLVLSMVVQG